VEVIDRPRPVKRNLEVCLVNLYYHVACRISETRFRSKAGHKFARLLVTMRTDPCIFVSFMIESLLSISEQAKST
jgi:hypothetical protein